MARFKGKVINRDSNKQLYRSGDSYEEQMRRPTERDAAIITLRKESEFVKPYASDSYEEMEYGFIPPPDFGRWNDLSFPDVKWATPDLQLGDFPPMDIEDPKEKCHVVLYCNQEVCYCPGQEKCFLMECSHRVVSIQLKEFASSGNPPAGYSITRGAGNEICITAPEGAHTTLDIYYLLEYQCDGKKFYEWVQSQAWIDACNESECCDDTGIAWDDPTSADTVARNASCTVAITDSLGKGGPYSWNVSGTGFSLANPTTVGLTNTLSADATACGTATVTVTGCDGAVVTGYVRCTTGQWVLQPLTTAWPYGPSPVNTIIGKYKLTGSIQSCYSVGGSTYYTYAQCEASFNSYFNNGDACCSGGSFPLGCQEAIACATYPNATYPSGAWNKYWNKCYVVSGGYAWRLIWLQNKYGVSFWTC